MKKIVIGDIVSRAWDLAVKHWPIFVLLIFVNSALSGLGMSIDPEDYITGIQTNSPEMIAEAVKVTPWLAVAVLIGIYLGYVILNLYVNASRTGKPYSTMSDAFKVDINQLAIYFVVDLCLAFIIAIGCSLCVLPGIWLGVRLCYAPLLAATQGASFTESFSRSWEMTKGNFWDLFLMGLTMIGIAILGFCACCVGYYFAAVVIYFMYVLSFYALKADDAPAQAGDYVEVQ